jgi:hypothetical protein
VTDIANPARRVWTSGATSLAVLGLLGIAASLVTTVALRMHGSGWTPDSQWNLFVLLLVLTAVIAITATKVAEKAPAGIALTIICVVALAMRLIVLSVDPILSEDIYRYVWDGRVQAAGINPYRYIPVDAALAHLRDAVIYPKIDRASYANTIYPPVAQMFFLAVTRIAESITVMRLALIGCEIVTFLALIDLLRRFNKPVTLAVAYAWHPLAVWEVANNGHVDALMVTLVMIGAWLVARHRRVAAGVFVALAALVKPYAIAALPACWRPWDWKLPLAVMLAIIACYLPYLGVGTGVFGFLFTGYIHEEGLQSGQGFWLVHAARTAFGNIPGLVPLYLALAAGTLGLLALRVAFARDPSPERSVRDMAMLLMVGLVLLSPNYPWYYLVVVAFIPIGGGTPAWVLSVGAILGLNIVYPDYEARFLLWKGLITVGFLIAVVATANGRVRSFIRMQGLPQWTR